MPKRITLEQRIRKLARRYRAQQRRNADKARRGQSSPQRTASWASTIGLVVLVQFAVCRGSASTFETANQNYAAGRFSEAAQGFEKVIAEQGYSAPALFNLGNAWLKAGQPGSAILNYERALRLAPGDAALRSNLRLARQKAGVVASENQFREKAARVLSLDTLTWVIVWSTALMCAVVLVGRLLPAFPRVAVRTLSGISALVLIVGCLGLAMQWPQRDRAVMLDASTPVRIAPASAAGELFSLPAGEIVQARESHGGYTLIHLRDGRSGWVKDAAVARVI